ncbi:hypothetical protein DM860_004314 [Cuscuta australis]|uniref:Uncharacterized protein n=1 Tax=Cuscuta australis TaxID=267555 RepID=A0A328EB89_9ASTE|nr:hypothetical protein DM860_004314 [Cuscuta australis]
MGKWNRRYIPRRNFNQYQNFPPADDETHSVILENSVPSWEIDFCKSVGMPWHKVVNMKKYICCFDNVVKWNDSASQLTFGEAKTRYWAKINGLPCDNPLPDPCKYVDEVDWNVYIDPELILDLEWKIFNSDEAEVNNLDDISEWTTSPDNKNPKDGETDSDRSKKLKSVNPWEENHTRTRGSSKSPGLISGVNDSWGQNPSCGLDNAWSSSWNNESGSAWCTSQKDWGDNKNTSWGQNAWNVRNHNGSQMQNVRSDIDHKVWNMGNYCDAWGNNTARGGGAPKKEGLRQWENNCRNWTTAGSQSHQPPYFEPERSSAGRESFYGGSKKREFSSYHTSWFKSSRFQGDEEGASYHWRKMENSKEYK